MKTTIEFSHEEQFDLKCAMQAKEMYFALTEILEFIRQKTKYTDETSIDFEDLRQKIVELCNENNVNLNLEN